MGIREELKNKKYCECPNEELWKEYVRTHDQEIKQELVIRYIYIVKNVAIQMRDVYVSFAQLDDIINEGVIVVMNAIDKYNIDKNIKFETYISKRVRGMIIDMARKQDWVPRTIRKSAREIDEASLALYEKQGRMPTSKEIADYMHMPLEKYRNILGKTNLFYILSLDMLMEEKAENKQTVQIPSYNDSEQPEEHFLGKEFVQILRDGIKELKENEKTVISLYYMEELSAKDIAKVLGVSEPRISQIHANAIRKLKLYIENTIQ